jgi:hypothetical protein
MAEEEPTKKDEAREKAILRRALEELENQLPATSDPYPAVPTRFGHLPAHTRQLLGKLTVEDVRTLARAIINIQRTGAFFRGSGRLVGWAVAAFTAAVLAGEKFLKFLEWLRGVL